MMRQLLTESTLLALAGGTLGLLLALWGVDLLSAFSTVKSIATDKIAIDAGVLAFAIAVTVLTGLACGLVPAWQASQLNLHDTLKEGRGAAIGNPRGHRLSNLLVISEIALSLVLLIGAGLMIRSFARLMAVQPGFDPRNVLTMQLSLSSLKYDKPEKTTSSYKQILERLSALPGVLAVGATSRMPMAGDRSTSGMRIEGREISPGEGIEVHYRVVTTGYFRTLNIPLRAGRELSEQDTKGTPGVLMISENAARRYWPGFEGIQDVVGKRVKLGPDANAPWLTIVGVAGDAHNFGLDADPRSEVYIPYQQNPDSRMRVVMRTSVEPHSLVGSVRETVGSVRSGLAGRAGHDDGRTARQVGCAAAVEYVAAGWVCRPGAGARGDGHLRRDVVGHRPAHTRNRHPDGAGRTRSRRVEIGHRTRNGIDVDRHGAWAAGFVRTYPIDDQSVVRRERNRSDYIWGDCGTPDTGGAAGVLHPGAAGYESGSADCTWA